VPVDFDVIVDVGPHRLPFHQPIGLGRQRLKRRMVDASKQAGARAFALAERPLIQTMQQFLHRFIEVGHGKKLPMPECG
jgi:hypothetical protein